MKGKKLRNILNKQDKSWRQTDHGPIGERGKYDYKTPSLRDLKNRDLRQRSNPGWVKS